MTTRRKKRNGTRSGTRGTLKPRTAIAPATGQSGPPLVLVADKVNPKEKAVASVLLRSGKVLSLAEIAEAAFPKERKGGSWTRNSLRRLVRGRWVAKAGPGRYRISPSGRRRLGAAASTTRRDLG